LLDNYSVFLTKDDRDVDLLRLALVIFKYVRRNDYVEVVTEILYEIGEWKNLYEDYEMNLYFREFIQLASSNYQINEVIKERVTEFIVDLTKGERDLFKSLDMLEKLVLQYSINAEEINGDELVNYFNDLLNEYINDEMENLEEFITDESEAMDKISEIEEIIERIEKLGLQVSSILDDYSGYDWGEMALHNEFRRLMEKDD
jgi:hypothetical protein